MRGSPNFTSPFRAGLNLRDSVFEMDHAFSPDCQNVYSDEDGILHKRQGTYTWINTFAGAGAFDIGSLYTSRNLLQTIAATRGQKVYKLNVAGVATDITGATGGFSNNSRWTFVELGDVYGINDVSNSPKTYTGIGSLAVWTPTAGTIPSGTFMVSFKNRIVMCGPPIGLSIYACAVGDPLNWDTTVLGSASAWKVTLGPQGSRYVAALGDVGPYLLAFTDTQIHVIYDMNTGANRPLSLQVGCVSPRSITRTPYGLVFLGTDGSIYLTDGSKLQKLSDVLESNQIDEEQTYLGQSRTTAFGIYSKVGQEVTANGFEEPSAIYYNDKYYIWNGKYLGNGGYTYVYDFIQKTWWRYTLAVRAWTIVNESSTAGTAGSVLVAAQANSVGSPLISYCFPPLQGDGAVQDNGSNFTAYHTAIPMNPIMIRRKLYNDLTVRRRIHAMRFWTSGNVVLQASTDVKVAPSTLATYSDAIANGYKQRTVYSMGVVPYIAFKVTSTDANNYSVRPYNIYTQTRAD